MISKNFLSEFLTRSQSSFLTSSLKCSFSKSRESLLNIETILELISKCLPNIILLSPLILTATLPVSFRASLIYLWLLSIESTTPIFILFCLSNRQRGVPTLRTPCSTSTPQTMGFLLLKTAMILLMLGNTAPFPSSLFLSSFTSFTN